MLTNILKHAKNKQQQQVITLFDLKNALGEVDHNLIKKLLKYYHNPAIIISLINSLYSDHFISIIAKDFIINPIQLRSFTGRLSLTINIQFVCENSYNVGNKAKGRISKRVFQGVRNVRFTENLTCFVFLKHPF